MLMYRVVCGFGKPSITKIEVEVLNEKYVKAQGRKQSITGTLKVFVKTLEEVKAFITDYHLAAAKILEDQIRWHEEQYTWAFYLKEEDL